MSKLATVLRGVEMTRAGDRTGDNESAMEDLLDHFGGVDGNLLKWSCLFGG